MKIGLLLCDHVSDRYRDIAGDYAEMFTGWLGASAPEIGLACYDAIGGEFPASAGECDGYLTTGSRYSVYDDEPWIHRLKSFVAELRAAGTPFVGICFGHQMLAEALGGKTLKSDYGWGIGVREIEIVSVESWMRPERRRVFLQYMHQDQVAALPPGSVLLGRSPHCPNAAFRVGDNMIGIQAHPEFTSPYAEALIRDRVLRIGQARAAEGLACAGDPTDERIIARWIYQFYLERC